MNPPPSLTSKPPPEPAISSGGSNQLIIPNTASSLLSVIYPIQRITTSSVKGNVNIPGLVSPTDSQKNAKKNLTSTTLMTPNILNNDHVLLTKQTLQNISLQSKDTTQHPTVIPTPLVPRPSGAVVLPKIPNFPPLRGTSAEESTIEHHHSHHHGGPVRLNKFVKRLYEMLQREKDSGIVEWRRGLLVLFSTDAFSKRLLPTYFNTRNFKTFRRQLNYYGFVHVRSFSATGNTTTALWINQELAENEANDDISAVLKLRRVEPCEAAKTVEGRRQRKELALHTVEEDIGLSSKTLQLDQIRSMAIRGDDYGITSENLLLPPTNTTNTATQGTTSTHDLCVGIPREVHILHESSMDHYAGNLAVQGEYNTIHDDQSADSSTPAMAGETNAAAANVLLMLSRS